MIPPMLSQRGTRMHITGRGTTYLVQSAHSPEQLGASMKADTTFTSA